MMPSKRIPYRSPWRSPEAQEPGQSLAIALMTKAGHANMATTRRYLRLAGVVFADEAEALERRLLGTVVPDTEEPQTALQSQTS